MIKLNTPYTTTVQYLSGNTVVSSSVTDTLYVSEVRLDFSTGAIYATIQRGTTVNGVFSTNYPSVDIVVNPDGSFISSDTKWIGTVPSAPALVTNLKSQFDQMLLSAGLVQGQQI